MATKTSVGSGLWSAAGTWDAGVPLDNEPVVIANGHVVEFDVDQSGFANGIDGLTVTGTLSLTRTAGTYYLKIKAAKTIGGAGTFDCGTSGSIIPFAAKHTITGGAGWYIQGSGGLTMTVYAAEPAIKTILLSGDEAIGQTELSVGTDITSDIWADGDTVYICDINKAKEAEERVIAAGGRAAGAITVTAGLTAAKSTGAVVSLVTRNVKFINAGANLLQNFTAGKLTVAGGMINATWNVFQNCSGVAISGGAYYGASIVVNSSVANITGGIFVNNTIVITSSGASVSGGSFSGNTTVFSASRNISVTGGTYKGNTDVFSGCFGLISGATVTGNTSGLTLSSFQVKNSTFTNGNDIYQSTATLYNCLLSGTNENNLYTSGAREIYTESIDHDQTLGAYKAWTKGGITTSQVSVLPTGYTKAFITVLESATVEGYWQREITVLAGEKVNIEMQLRKAVSMTYLPRCYVFLPTEDPFASGTPEHTFTMTDSTDTWESETHQYDNSAGTEPVTLIIRFQGMNASGNVYSALSVTEEGGGGGAVSIRPITGMVQL